MAFRHQPAPPAENGPLRIAEHRGTISVVIPAYNEAERVERCLQETVVTLNELGCPYAVILVDDGSADDTYRLARQTAQRTPRISVIGNGTNLGKGSAIRRGAGAARGDLVVFMDADLEVHPRQLSLLYQALVEQDADVVIGSKLHRESRVDYPWKRRFLSLGYYLLVRALFRLPVHDTQTGLKLYRREVLDRVVPRTLVKRFAHDLELLVNAHRLGYRIVEAPVVVTRQRPFPRIGLADVRHVAVDTAAIWYRTYVTRWYDRKGREVDRHLSAAPALRTEAVLAREERQKLVS